MNTTVVFNADTAAWSRNLQQAEKDLLATGNAVDRVKAKILASSREQVEAAVKAGKSQQDLDRIQIRNAERLAAVTEQNASRSEAALDRLVAKRRAVALELQRLGNVQAQRLGNVQDQGDSSYGHGFTDRMATSAVVRGLAGNSGIRSIENTLTLIPGLTQAAQGLAPLIGGAGLAGLFYEMGEKAYEAFEKVKLLPQAIKDGWQGINQPIELEADNLRKANAELDISIAKLEHKPENTLALSIAETRIEVDKLAQSALHAYGDVTRLLKENSSGLEAFLLNGSISTGPAENEIKQRMRDRLTAALDLQDATTSGSASPDQIQAAKDALEKKDRDNAKWAHDSRTQISSFNQNGSLDSVVNDLVGFEQFSRGSADQSQLSDENAAKQKILKDLQDLQSLGKESDKANEQRLRQAEAFVAQWKLEAPVSAKAIFDYWEQQKQTFSVKSNEYNSIVEKQAALSAEGVRAAHEAIAKYLKSTQENNDLSAPGKIVNVLGNTEQTGRELQNAYAKAASGGAQLQAEMAKAKVEVDLADGSISKLSADQQLAAIAAQMHAVRLHDLNVEIADLKTHSSSYNSIADAFDSDKEQQKYVELKVEVSKETTAGAIDQVRDAAKVAADDWSGALKNANALWVQDAQDTARQVAQLYQQVLGGLNQNLVNGMFGDKTDWSGMFKGIGKTIAGDGLKHLEAAGLKSLGIAAKADGSKANPFYVIDASGVSAAAGAGMKSLGSLFGSAATSNSSSASSGSSALGNFVGLAAKSASLFFGGGFALGGDVQPGVAYDVGEMGRERFVPKVPGTIIPHNQLGSNAAHYTLQVANGVAPEQMHMYVQAALQQFHPRVVRDSVAASMDRSARLPSTRG